MGTALQDELPAEGRGGETAGGLVNVDHHAMIRAKHSSSAGRTMIKISDYVLDRLAAAGVRDIFLVSGGGIMHLVDSVGRHPSIRYTCNYHEQACAIAAEAYARVTEGIGACLVTTGPGSTNGLSGVAGAWYDSIPVFTLSGQVRVPLIADYARVRQVGPQEVNIVPMAQPVTKYATTVREASAIAREVDKALALATSGRPGPVWLDLPLDIQSAMIDAASLERFTGEPSRPEGATDVREAVERTLQALRTARRPVLIAGNGVRLGRTAGELLSVLDATQIPALLTIAAMDLVPEEYPQHLGAFGPVGRRSSNFALQNSDLVLSIGASLSIASIGFNTTGFAPRAKKIMVNVDPGEFSRTTLRIDYGAACDAKEFLREMRRRLAAEPFAAPQRWLDACHMWKENYPPGPPADRVKNGVINSYVFAEELSKHLLEGEIVVNGISLDVASIYQSFRVKPRQRVLVNANYGAMGWDLPAAVGACVAAEGRRVVLVTGDGSIHFNIHELQTVRQNNLNLRIFVLSNEGYESIRATQKNWFEGRLVGSDAASGIGSPDFEKLAAAYRIDYRRLATPAEVEPGIREVLEHDGPILCEVMISPEQERTPKLSSFRREDGTMESRPLEDMYPFLPREEIHRNMHLFDDEEQQ